MQRITAGSSRTVCLILPAMAVLLAGAGPTTQPSVAAPETPVTKVYDVTDLVALPSESGECDEMDPTKLWPRPYMGAGGGHGLFGNPISPEDNPPRTRAYLLQELVKSVVPLENRGLSITPAAEAFILAVTGPPAVHRQVEDLLAQVRKISARKVVIQAQWILLDEKQWDKLTRDPKRRGAPVEVPGEFPKGAEAEVLYRGNVSTHVGCPAKIISGRAQTVVAKVDALVSEYAATMYPTMRTVLWGAILDVTPTISPSGDAATLDLTSVVSDPHEMRSIRIPDPVGQGSATTKPVLQPGPALDGLDFDVQRFHTKVTVPFGKTVLVSAMTAPGKSKPKVLCLILEVSAPQ